MNPNPRFSIIVPVYNRIDEVAELLESLSRQTCRDFEVIIVDDGSTEPCGKTFAPYPFVSDFWKEN
ncbi:MAG: glycosyltransferase, partial [Muribaculaceae bacterium]|nr:glycosyltransferase [Muribaculaceae bacterium]